MPPAGMGILPIVGSIETLTHTIEEVLSILGLTSKYHESSSDIAVTLDDEELAHGVQVRKYNSMFLLPNRSRILTIH